MKHIKLINRVYCRSPRCSYCGETNVDVNGDWKYICYDCNLEFDEDDAK